jgi:hypothetical protein
MELKDIYGLDNFDEGDQNEMLEEDKVPDQSKY